MTGTCQPLKQPGRVVVQDRGQSGVREAEIPAWCAVPAAWLLAPLLLLPQLPVIGLPPAPFHPRDKLPAVIGYAGRRPLTWIDDQHPDEAHAWAAERGVPTLLIGTDPASGLTRPVVERSLRWAEEHRRPAG